MRFSTRNRASCAYLGSGVATNAVPEAAPPLQAAPVVEASPIVVTVPVPAVEKPVGDVGDLLLELVAKRTGYPREMLGLDLDMEADLGIDSIKRVEILGELQRARECARNRRHGAPRACRTLGQVVSTIGRVAPAGTIETPRGWVGAVEAFTPGRQFVGVRQLDADHDPVAIHHTLGGRRISQLDPSLLGLPVIPYTVMAELLAGCGDVAA